MEGKKIFQNSNQNIKVNLDAVVSVKLMLTSVYRRISPQTFHQNGRPWLDAFHKGWSKLIAYGGSILKQIGIKRVA